VPKVSQELDALRDKLADSALQDEEAVENYFSMKNVLELQKSQVRKEMQEPEVPVCICLHLSAFVCICLHSPAFFCIFLHFPAFVSSCLLLSAGVCFGLCAGVVEASVAQGNA
jgi:hypothetical protein